VWTVALLTDENPAAFGLDAQRSEFFSLAAVRRWARDDDVRAIVTIATGASLVDVQRARAMLADIVTDRTEVEEL